MLDEGDRLGWEMLAMGIWADQLYMADHNGVSIEDQWRTQGNGDWVTDYLVAALGNNELQLGIPREEENNLGFDYKVLPATARERRESTSSL